MSFNSGRIINELLSGRRLVRTAAAWAPIIFCQGLTGKEKILAELHYEDALDEALEMEIPLEEALKRDLMLRDVWGAAQEMLIKETRAEAKRHNKSLKDFKYKRALYNAALKKLKKTQERRDSLLLYKNSLFSNTAERYAQEQKIWWGIHKMAFYTNGKPIWATYEDFASADIDDTTAIVNAYLGGFRLASSEARRIARHPEWRIYFNTCKNSRDLFDRPLSDLDENQSYVLYWSVVYDNAINSYEPPSDDTLEDDDLFDVWLEDVSSERRKERALSKHGGKGKNGASKSETFVMTDAEGAQMLYEEIS
jgi:hypothetical protein